jgi:hypothetical protein
MNQFQLIAFIFITFVSMMYIFFSIGYCIGRISRRYERMTNMYGFSVSQAIFNIVKEEITYEKLFFVSVIGFIMYTLM